MKTLTKALVGTVAAGAMVVGSATPALAQSRNHDNGIDVGDVIAGALIIGGIAAVATAASRGNRNYNDGYVYEGGNNGGYYNGSRYSYGGQSQVTDIRQIDRKRDGYTVKGRIAVNTRNANWQRGWGNDYRGYNNAYRGYDSGNFTCKVRYGQVVDLDYSGVRGLG